MKNAISKHVERVSCDTCGDTGFVDVDTGCPMRCQDVPCPTCYWKQRALMWRRELRKSNKSLTWHAKLTQEMANANCEARRVLMKLRKRNESLYHTVMRYDE